MKTILITICILSWIFSADLNADIKNGSEVKLAMLLYEKGNLDQANNQLKLLGLTATGAEAAHLWLNISILYYEKQNPRESQLAFQKAISLSRNQRDKLYVQLVKSIFDNTKINLDLSVLDDYKSTSNGSTKFLLWQILCYKLMEANEINLTEYELVAKEIKIGVQPNTVRSAKILSLESVFQFLRNDYNAMANSLLRSNKLLENLKLSESKIYYKNVWRLFYYFMPFNAPTFREQILELEQRFSKTKDKEIEAALYFFKSRYSSYTKDKSQDLYYMKKAYALFPNNPGFITRLAYSYQFLNDYESAIPLFKKLFSYPQSKIEGYLGITHCASKMGNMDLYRKNCLAMLNDKQFEQIEMDEFLRFIRSIYTNAQYDLFPKINPAIIKRFRATFPKSIEISEINSKWGSYSWIIKDYEKSLEYYHRAIIDLLPHESSTNVFEELNFDNCVSWTFLCDCLNAKAEAFCMVASKSKELERKVRYLKGGLKNFQLSIEHMHKNKMQYPIQEQMYLYSDFRSKRFPRIIKVCLDLYTLTGDKNYHYLAFKYAEQGKATIMLSMMRSKQGSKIGMVPEKYKALEDSLSSQLSALMQKIRIEQKEKYNLYAQLDILATKRKELEAIFKKHYPQYYNLKYSMDVVDPQTIQKSLKKDECVIEYLLSSKSLITFYLDNKNFKILNDTLHSGNLAQLSEQFYNRVYGFNSSSYKPDSIEKFARDGLKLYEILLKPLENELKGKKITIIADNNLNKLPFEVLITKFKASMKTYRDFHYLVKTNPIYYAPSVTFIHELRQRPVLGDRSRLLALAPVYSSLKLNDTISRMLLAVRSDTSIYGSLPNAKKEIEFAHAIAGGRLLKEKAATETRFKKLSENFDIIHLATHGILHKDSFLQSKLLFAESGPKDDGFLHNYEIYNLKNHSKLVILSACNTGAGKNYGGEGVISTGRAFLSSGSRSVLMTIWPVNDQASLDLIKEFYNGLANQLSVCEALQQSKIKYIDQADNLHSHPYFWTGYVVYGDGAIKLVVGNNKSFYLILLGILIFVPLGFWFTQKLRKSFTSVF